MPAGTCVLLGSARKGTEVSFETPFLQNGRTVRGVIQGDSVPQDFIPQLVDHIMAGRFAVDRMITFYPLARDQPRRSRVSCRENDQAGLADAALGLISVGQNSEQMTGNWLLGARVRAISA